MQNLLLQSIGILIGYWSHLLVDKITNELEGKPIKTKGFEPTAITLGIAKSTIYFTVGIALSSIMFALDSVNINLIIFKYALLTLCVFGLIWLLKVLIIASKYHIDLYIAKIIVLRQNYLSNKKAKSAIRQAEAKKVLEAEALKLKLANEVPSRGILEKIN